jgi:acyl-CoA synthetase (NDP forming)
VTSAVFRQFGVTRVDGLDELLDVAAMFARTQPPADDLAPDAGVCVYSISGGTGAHMADLCASAGLRLPALTDETQRALHQWIPPYLRVSNPVDSGGPPVADERGRKILDAIVADPNVALLLVPITGALETMSAPFARDLVDVSTTTDKPIFVVWGSPVGDEAAYRDILLDSQLPVFRTFANAVRAAKAYFDYHEFQRSYRSPFDKPVLRPSAAAKSIETPLRSDEWSSMAVLHAYGIPTPRMQLATSAKDAVRAAESIGYPVVLKACGDQLLHKSDLGVVRVGVTSARDVRSTYAEFAEKAPAMDGVIVAEVVPSGVETVLGVSQDDLFGPVVMFGLGGVFVEVLRDVTFRVPPFTKVDAERMLRGLMGSALLEGGRGRP